MAPVKTGEKFACLAFCRFNPAPVLLGPYDFGRGRWALPGLPVPMDDRWRAWLGEIESGQLEQTNLALLAVEKSAQPLLIGPEREDNPLRARVQYLHWGIVIVAGVSAYEHAVVVRGGDEGTGPVVRQIGYPKDIYPTGQDYAHGVSIDDLAEAAGIATQLESIQTKVDTEGGYRRLMRGVNAFVAGLRSHLADDRLHQFVRAVESFIPPTAWGADQFAAHVKTFLPDTPDPTEILKQMYQLRNAAEHLRDLDWGLPTALASDRQWVAMLRLRQVEALCRMVYRKLFMLKTDYLEHFRDDESITQFWSQPRDWGEPFNMSAGEPGCRRELDTCSKRSSGSFL